MIPSFSYFRHLVLLSFVIFLCIPTITSASELDFSNLFGYGNHIHPFIELETVFSDNIFETKNDKESDTIVYTRPGIWLCMPGADQQIVDIETSTDSAGGATLTRFNDNEMIRYQSYFLYSPEFETYLGNSDYNEINHTAEGYFLYNFPGGLSVELLDKYITSHDDIIKDYDNIDYANNYLSGSVAYDATEKIRLRLDYDIFNVDYESRANVKDRVDNTISTYVFFKIRPKTSIFFQYINTDVDYDSSVSSQSWDSTENSFLLGLRWDVTSKTTGTLKAGYQNKDYDNSELGDADLFKVEMTGKYEINGRSSLTCRLRNEFTESDEAYAYYIKANSLLTVYEYSVTERITGYMGLFYEQEDYGRIDRKDTTLDISPSLAYAYNDWLSFNAAYTFETVDSTGSDKDEDYTKNSILLSLSAAF